MRGDREGLTGQYGLVRKPGGTMIPTKLADMMTQALDALDAKGPPGILADASARMRRVATTYAADETSFNPVDFTESDLSEATKVFELAARKHVAGFDGAIADFLTEFRSAMNTAEGQKDRIKARVTLVVQEVATAAKRL
jgi:hypothetical protein